MFLFMPGTLIRKLRYDWCTDAFIGQQVAAGTFQRFVGQRWNFNDVFASQNRPRQNLNRRRR